MKYKDISRGKNKAEIKEMIKRGIAERGYVIVLRSMSGSVVSEQDAEVPPAEARGEGEFYFRITDYSKDSHETRFDPDKWRMDSFKRNPVITAQHPDLGDVNTYLFIGRGTIERHGNAWYSAATLQRGSNPVANDVREKVEQRIFNNTSIYARVYDYEERGDDIVFTDQELITYGIVAFASNSNSTRIMEETDDEETPEPAPTDTVEEETEEQKNQRLLQIMEIENRILLSMNLYLK